MRSSEVIQDQGRGPAIKGTRITVYDILDYVLQGWHPARIAAWLHVSSRQVEKATEYIREHKLEVLTNYVGILEREARGNSPEVEKRLRASHGKARQLARHLRRNPRERTHAGTAGRL